MADVVLVVDMLRGFLEKGYPLYCGDDARRIIPRVRDLLERENASGSRIIFICDNHAANDLEFQMFPPHCVKGTEEAEVIPELASFAKEVVPKQRYSAFFNTDLDDRIRQENPSKITVCGVCTDICVMHTVADARNRDYLVEVPADCVATFDPKAHHFALQHISKILGARVTSISSRS